VLEICRNIDYVIVKSKLSFKMHFYSVLNMIFELIEVYYKTDNK